MTDIAKEVNKDLESLRTGYSRFESLDDAVKLDVDENVAAYIGLPISELLDYPNWYLKNGKHFYFKERTEVSSLLNELLGQDLSEFMGLPTIKYDIVENSEGRIIGLLSEDIRKKNVIYRQCRYFRDDERDYIFRVLTDSTVECDQNFKRDLTYYVVRNYYSSLRARLCNSEVIVSEGGYEIPPLMDYESSYIDPMMITYSDPLITFTFNEDTIAGLRENNEYFDEALNRVMDYSYLEALNIISKKHNINIPYSVRSYYMEFQQNRKQTMDYMGFKVNSKTK